MLSIDTNQNWNTPFDLQCILHSSSPATRIFCTVNVERVGKKKEKSKKKRERKKNCFVTIPCLLKGKPGNVYHSAVYREGNRSKLKPKRETPYATDCRTPVFP